MKVRFKANVKLRANSRVWDGMSRRLLAGQRRTTQIGWFGATHPSGHKVAQIAAWNEEGHFNGGTFAGTYTPPRPFMRTGFVPAAKKTIPQFYKDIDMIAKGKMSWSVFYHRVGIKYQKLLQETILKWSKPPNSPTTIGMKGFNNPLIETGYMHNSVTYKIVQKRRV